MSFEMECPCCGEGYIEVEETSYSKETPATRDHPGDPAEIEFSVISFCKVCGCSEQNIFEEEKLLDKVMDAAFEHHVEPEDDRDWSYDDEIEREYDY